MEAATAEPIYFYSKLDAYAEFSNFSPHGFAIDGEYWPTVEHYFQAQKFPTNPDYQKTIRLASDPKKAKSLGRNRKIAIRPDWDTYRDEVMKLALHAKFTSHPSLRKLLVGTGERQLIEMAPMDYYWGCGKAGTGRNRLGEMLIALRSQLGLQRVDGSSEIDGRPPVF